MLILFAFTVIMALVFSIILFFTLEEDMQKKSLRPFFLLFFTIISWSMTIPALVAPEQTTVMNPSVTIVTATAGNIVIQASNSIVTNSPFPIATFWTYLPFATAMIAIFSLMLLLWLMNWFKQKTQEAIDNA